MGVDGMLPVPGEAEAQVLERKPVRLEVRAPGRRAIGCEDLGAVAEECLKWHSEEESMKDVDRGIDGIGLRLPAELVILDLLRRSTCR